MIMWNWKHDGSNDSSIEVDSISIVNYVINVNKGTFKRYKNVLSGMDLEGENIVLIVTFLVLISLVYLTGFIVWVCCRHPHTSNDAYDDADPNVTRKRYLVNSIS